MKKLKRRKGFTLIELIVVIAVLGILAAVAVPKYSGMKDKAREAVDLENMASMQRAVDLYYAEHDKYPGSEANLKDAIEAILDEVPEPQQKEVIFGMDDTGTDKGKVQIFDKDDTTSYIEISNSVTPES